MKLKRIAAMLTAAVMAVSLAACGGNTGTNTESSQNPKENAEAQAVHLNLAESWGFEYFYTILTPEVSNIGSPLYVWVFSDYAISEASEEMSANYAEILSTLTSPWFMVLAIAATVVISIIVGVIAKKVYNKQFANAGIM